MDLPDHAFSTGYINKNLIMLALLAKVLLRYFTREEKNLLQKLKCDEIMSKFGTTWTKEMLWNIVNDLDFKTAKAVELEERAPYVELSAMCSLEDIAALGMPDSKMMVNNLWSPAISYYAPPRGPPCKNDVWNWYDKWQFKK